jgi:hypothetical protein
MLQNMNVFLEHGDEWREADAGIVENRERYERVDPPGCAELQRAVSYEVAACDAMWQGEWDRALQLARQVLDSLRGGRAPQRYAALWHYLASCIARRLYERTGDGTYNAAAAKSHSEARAAGRGTTWLSHLAAPADNLADTTAATLDPLDEQAMTGARANAARLAKPAVFEDEIARARTALEDTPAKAYESALVLLGQLLGATPSEGDGNNDSAPDATWIFGRTTWVGWEAKSEAKPAGELGAGDVRQASGHLRFAADRHGAAAPGDSIVVLVTPQQRIHESAHAVAEAHVYLARPPQILDLFDRVVRAWRAARSRDMSALSIDDLAVVFEREGALPSQWLPSIRTEPLARP